MKRHHDIKIFNHSNLLSYPVNEKSVLIRLAANFETYSDAGLARFDDVLTINCISAENSVKRDPSYAKLEALGEKLFDARDALSVIKFAQIYSNREICIQSYQGTGRAVGCGLAISRFVFDNEELYKILNDTYNAEKLANQSIYQFISHVDMQIKTLARNKKRTT